MVNQAGMHVVTWDSGDLNVSRDAQGELSVTFKHGLINTWSDATTNGIGHAGNEGVAANPGGTVSISLCRGSAYLTLNLLVVPSPEVKTYQVAGGMGQRCFEMHSEACDRYSVVFKNDQPIMPTTLYEALQNIRMIPSAPK